MPPEPLPWDRKDFFRERKHSYDRPPEPLGSGARWRDSSSHGSSRNDFGRWGFPSEFRRPPGHGRQGSWQVYSEEYVHGYGTARFSDRFVEDGGYRPSGPRGDGRYPRNFRENRGSFTHKDWRNHSWDHNHHHGVPSTSSTGRMHDPKEQRSIDEASPRASVSQSESLNRSSQPHLKELPDKDSDINGPGGIQKSVKENSAGVTDWKPIKWSRSGGLTSRGSGFSHSNSSKSLSGENPDIKCELPLKIATPTESPSGDATACTTPTASLEETTSRKKPRLGWGEGLAKYEKKKDVSDEVVYKNGNGLCTTSVEPIHSPAGNLSRSVSSPAVNLAESVRSPASNVAEKSPRCGLDCVSPATPSSVACSSSLGLPYMKVADIDSDANNLSPSPVPSSQDHFEGISIDLEHGGVNSFSNVSGLINDLLLSEGNCSSDSGFTKCSALTKLLVLKGELLKALELTESDIDSRENELKLLRSEAGNVGGCPESSSSLFIGCKEKPHGGLCEIPKPRPLACFTAEDVIVENVVPCSNNIKEGVTQDKDEDVDSPGSATSKLVESLSLEKPSSSGMQRLLCAEDEGPAESASFGAHAKVTLENTTKSTAVGVEGITTQIVVSKDSDAMLQCKYFETDVCNRIFISNKETATRASEVFGNLLPCSNDSVEPVEAIDEACSRNYSIVRERFLKTKQSQRFKERVISLKYKALLHLWKEELRLISIRKLRSKSVKKLESSSRSLYNGFQKHRSSIRSRLASQAGNLSLVPTTETLNYTSKLLSNPRIRIYRDELKMPAMILDEKERKRSRFLSSNGLVEDPCAVEKERSIINPWTPEEKGIFLDKLAIFGKDFRKISLFINHKTTADCVEFYYKNHKSECFKKTKKKLDLKKQEKFPTSNRYLITSGKRWNRETNAASLDMLGAASAIVAHVDEDMESVKLFSGILREKKFRKRDGFIEGSNSFEVEDERETEAADVLAGICGSLSSEAMSSCITSSIDPVDGTQDWKCQRTSSGGTRWPLTPDVTQNVEDDTCSDESCGDVDTVDWTDEEKSVFVQAFSSYGKDFMMISRCVRTKSRDQCKVFFSKARKCLGLDSECPGSRNVETRAGEGRDGGGSDTEDGTCIVENDSAVCSDKSGGRMDENMSVSPSNVNNDDDLNHNVIDLHDGMSHLEKSDRVKLDEKVTVIGSHNLRPGDDKSKRISEPACDEGTLVNGEVENSARVQNPGSADLPLASNSGGKLTGEQEICTTEAATDVISTELGSPTSVAESEPKVVVDSERAMENPQSELNLSGLEELFNESAIQPPLDAKLVPSDMQLGKIPLKLSVRTDFERSPCQTRPSSTGSISRTEATNAQPLQVYFKKCNRAGATMANSGNCELPFISKNKPQTIGETEPPPLSSDSEKPSRNGGVKLFGQILSKSSSVEKNPTPAFLASSSSSEEINIQRRPRSAGGLDLGSASHETDPHGNGNVSNGLQNFPMRSFGFWDGTRIRTGLSSLPDSALLLAKYPDAFSKLDVTPLPSSKLEPPSIQLMTSACEPRRGSSSVPVAPDYSHDRTHTQSNGVQGVTGLEQINMNLVQGDVRVAGSYTPGALTDPVVALKLHYTRAQTAQQQYTGGSRSGSSGEGEEVAWRGSGQRQGDVGR